MCCRRNRLKGSLTEEAMLEWEDVGVFRQPGPLAQAVRNSNLELFNAPASHNNTSNGSSKAGRDADNMTVSPVRPVSASELANSSGSDAAELIGSPLLTFQFPHPPQQGHKLVGASPALAPPVMPRSILHGSSDTASPSTDAATHAVDVGANAQFPLPPPPALPDSGSNSNNNNSMLSEQPGSPPRQQQQLMFRRQLESQLGGGSAEMASRKSKRNTISTFPVAVHESTATSFPSPPPPPPPLPPVVPPSSVTLPKKAMHAPGNEGSRASRVGELPQQGAPLVRRHSRRSSLNMVSMVMPDDEDGDSPQNQAPAPFHCQDSSADNGSSKIMPILRRISSSSKASRKKVKFTKATVAEPPGNAETAAVSWLKKEVQIIIDGLKKYGSRNSKGQKEASFGTLFTHLSDRVEALSGTLLAAKRNGIVYYDGDLLLQHFHHATIITLNPEFEKKKDFQLTVFHHVEPVRSHPAPGSSTSIASV
jgi:hypothetical protein